MLSIAPFAPFHVGRRGMGERTKPWRNTTKWGFFPISFYAHESPLHYLAGAAAGYNQSGNSGDTKHAGGADVDVEPEPLSTRSDTKKSSDGWRDRCRTAGATPVETVWLELWKAGTVSVLESVPSWIPT